MDFGAASILKPNFRCLFGLLLGAAAFSYTPPAFAADPILLDTIIDQLEVGGLAEVFEDKHGQLTLYEVLESSRAERWTLSNKKIPNFGLSDSVYWLRFQVSHEEFIAHQWLLEIGYQFLDSIELYSIGPSGDMNYFRGGDRLPFDERVISHHNFVFPLDVKAGEARTILVRVESSSTVQVPLTIYTADALRKSERSYRLGIGVFYGILLVTVFYNLFIYILTRDPSHALYLCYVLSLGWTGICGNGIWGEFVVPESPYWVNRGLLLSLTLLCLFGNLFTYSFLQMKKRTPVLAKISRVISSVAVVILVASLLMPYRTVVSGIVLLASSLVVLWLTSAIRVHGQGYHPARYYLASWGTLLVGIVALLLKTVGWLPSTFVTTHSLQLSTAAEVVLLSLALADRLRVLTSEKEEAEAEQLLSKHIMNRYLPTDLVEELLAKELSMDESAHTRDITVLFADLAGFTSTCERFGAQVITQLLNTYLSTMSDIIFEYGGTIDKFIGDAVMVIFGAPKAMSRDEQLNRAVDCALDMQRAMEEFQETSKARNLPQLNMRIGIHRGPAVVGNFGSKKRSDYTCIGHTVNVASRIESACVPGQIFVSQAVANGLAGGTEPAGTFELKGVQNKQPLFRVRPQA